jgi:hypothetical protein
MLSQITRVVRHATAMLPDWKLSQSSSLASQTLRTDRGKVSCLSTMHYCFQIAFSFSSTVYGCNLDTISPLIRGY